MYWVTSIYFVGKVVKCRMHNKTGFTGNIQFYLKIKARLQWLSVLSMSLEKQDGATHYILIAEILSGKNVRAWVSMDFI